MAFAGNLNDEQRQHLLQIAGDSTMPCIRDENTAAVGGAHPVTKHETVSDEAVKTKLAVYSWSRRQLTPTYAVHWLQHSSTPGTLRLWGRTEGTTPWNAASYCANANWDPS